VRAILHTENLRSVNFNLYTATIEGQLTATIEGQINDHLPSPMRSIKLLFISIPIKAGRDEGGILLPLSRAVPLLPP